MESMTATAYTAIGVGDPDILIGAAVLLRVR